MSGKIERRQFLRSGASMMAAALLPTCSSVFAQDSVGHTGANGNIPPPPEWPQGPHAPAGAPNVVLILIDDIGFSATSTFGGVIATPNFDRLAKQGLRYNEFHVNAICSPTRASLLSGRNCHQIGFGLTADLASGYPGYNSYWPKNAASVAEVLKANGYSTAAFGKWHNTPLWEVGPAGPFDRWPTGLGFEYFYGFMKGADDQYYTRLFRDTTPVEPASTPQQGYDFTTDMTNDAIHWLHAHDAVAPEKPFFIYYAPGATHFPHQVPNEWIEPYKGKFDQGWDKLREETFIRQKKLGVIPANAELTPRPPALPAWDSLSADEKKLVAHQAEVFAGFAEQTDYEVGRLLQAIRDEGKSENTLVFEIFGDNGGSAEGGTEGTDLITSTGKPASLSERLAVSDEFGSEFFMNHFAAAWAWAMSTPFQGTKWDASHLGGTRDPLVVSWPARIKSVGQLRTQFQHVNDVAPTIYEAAGITFPDTLDGVKQIPLEGSSFIYTFDHPNEPSHHHVQYFATNGNRAIYKDGWWAGDLYWWNTWVARGVPPPGSYDVIDKNPWELYNLSEDYSQAHNLAAKYPEKLKELQALFTQEALRNHAFPLLPGFGPQPAPSANKTVFIYREGVERLTGYVAPRLAGRPHQITAEIAIPEHGGDGVIIAQGSRFVGFTLFVKDRHVFYEVTAYGKRGGRIVSQDRLPAGVTHIVLQVIPDPVPANADPGGVWPGKVFLNVNGRQQEANFANVFGTMGWETLDVGSDLGSAVSSEYTSPNRFTGTIKSVRVELK